MHCHAAGIGAGNSGCFVSAQMRDSFKFRLYLRSFGVTEAEVQAAGDGLILQRLSAKLAQSRYVKRAVVLAIDGVVDERTGEMDRARTEFYVPNEFLAAEVPKYKNLLWGASVNPLRKDALARLAWAKAHGAVLVKWLPPIQGFDPADPRLVPFYDKLVELHLPLLVHTGPENSFTKASDELGDPSRLELAAKCGVTVIAAHAGCGEVWLGSNDASDDLARLMRKYPNVYADISALALVTRGRALQRVLQNPAFTGRLLYGSDYPLIEMTVLESACEFPFSISPWNARRIMKEPNAWDRDVLLKQQLGVPRDVWTRWETLVAEPEAESRAHKADRGGGPENGRGDRI